MHLIPYLAAVYAVPTPATHRGSRFKGGDRVRMCPLPLFNRWGMANCARACTGGRMGTRDRGGHAQPPSPWTS